jgi:hypothetical protein
MPAEQLRTKSEWNNLTGGGSDRSVRRYSFQPNGIQSTTLMPDGTWMIVEPYAEDAVEANHNPIGRIYFLASTLLCVPAFLSQEVGAALGAQAGENNIRSVVTAGGFTRFRRATQTAFNLAFEARP